MFAFFFFDTVTNNWLLARDHFGIKPLYYTNISEQMLFASEIKALLIHPSVKSEVNNEVLQEYLTLQLPLSQQTLFSNIFEVQPGTYIKGHQSQIIETKKYWDISYNINFNINENEYIEELTWLLNDSIKLQIRSDVPLGSHLSGGLDSSTIAYFASQNVSNKLSLFTGRFSEGLNYDESKYANIVSQHINGELHIIEPSLDDFINLLPNLIYMLDQPLAGPGVFPQYLVNQRASESVKVVLSGQGGDELFGGYARYLIAYLEQALKGTINETLEEGSHAVTFASLIPNLPLLKEYQPLMQHFWQKGLFEPMDSRYFHLITRSPNLNNLLSKEKLESFRSYDILNKFKQIFNTTDAKSYINKMINFDLKVFLPALLQVEDRVSMANSIEARVPLLDKRIVELITKMPPMLKFQGGQTKQILKLAVNSVLPKEILDRKDKKGFPVPLNEWWKTKKLKEFVSDTLLSKASKQRGIFKYDEIINKVTQDKFDRELWGMLCLELWHQQFIDLKNVDVKIKATNETVSL